MEQDLPFSFTEKAMAGGPSTAGEQRWGLNEEQPFRWGRISLHFFSMLIASHNDLFNPSSILQHRLHS